MREKLCWEIRGLRGAEGKSWEANSTACRNRRVSAGEASSAVPSRGMAGVSERKREAARTWSSEGSLQRKGARREGAKVNGA
eukprot:7792012-Prorocentrum_lima.AAC.1